MFIRRDMRGEMHLKEGVGKRDEKSNGKGNLAPVEIQRGFKLRRSLGLEPEINTLGFKISVPCFFVSYIVSYIPMLLVLISSISKKRYGNCLAIAGAFSIPSNKYLMF